MSLESFLKEVEETKSDWSNRAFGYVVDAARKILDEQPNDVDEFVMGMGTYIFTAKEGGAYDTNLFTDEDYDSDRFHMDTNGNLPHEFAPKFAELVEKLDYEIGVTGIPVRFKRGMEAVYNWGDTVKNPVRYLPIGQ